jgi:hypothetical protein
MTNKIVVDCSTGEVQEIALTAEEIAEREAMAAEYAEQKAQEEADKAAKAAAKQAGQDKLKALGLTDLEIAAITGA